MTENETAFRCTAWQSQSNIDSSAVPLFSRRILGKRRVNGRRFFSWFNVIQEGYVPERSCFNSVVNFGPENGSSMFLLNIDIYLQVHMALQLRRTTRRENLKSPMILKLFNDVVSSEEVTCYIVSNKVGRWFGGGQPWPIYWYNPVLAWKDWGKPHRIIRPIFETVIAFLLDLAFFCLRLC
jgi:hypothetical protein